MADLANIQELSQGESYRKETNVENSWERGNELGTTLNEMGTYIMQVATEWSGASRSV